MNETEMIQEMLHRAARAGVTATEYLPRIAKARIRMGLDITQCPCAKEDTDRGCISAKCLREIEEDGVCHCNCFERSAKDDKDS